MAFKDTITLRRSIFTVAMYYSAIYFPLVIIFCCARVLMPGREIRARPDHAADGRRADLQHRQGAGWPDC
ncbi:MAG: hypothetical protein Ct9H300mP1_10330 [Planctomycetaceae bacterium]|nr:MAG: hypothetical protein Ct9H300mP1_10330 [Planctomycetaceae bacterium]